MRMCVCMCSPYVCGYLIEEGQDRPAWQVESILVPPAHVRRHLEQRIASIGAQIAQFLRHARHTTTWGDRVKRLIR
jgi:hypothetical protein